MTHVYMIISLSAYSVLCPFTNFSQSTATWPSLLKGTWKVETSEQYEHWDVTDKHTLKGMAYTLPNGLPHVSEYLEIKFDKKGKTTYTATVLGQNNGQSIDFRLTESGEHFKFTNPKHDFPKEIIYKPLDENSLKVTISDGKQRNHSYVLTRANQASSEDYDAALAARLGADEYGMKSYTMVILTTGSASTEDKAAMGAAFKGHMSNIHRLAEEGKLVVAGPFGKNEMAYRGIFILATADLDDAKALVNTDPAIEAGYLKPIFIPWYGSAALPEYLPLSKRISRQKP